ncbi:NAD(P)/FAD-dependent oxidoreductase [Nocardioides marmoriginsengisoli]|uniref:NAD(P)/FAD-dependent oxidoreductase n=1 Tax=Nocardioides marmoriginsengisoli TaxID=661483 RepID=A0A3N0CNI1_9ACTN|nr:NAD(P)/FAD-dependent oxidoreductase [Nocardioides marmoriginsengisoli]RNL65018.1 NAD(P)/FAD-dependent oxidoreductase [Nocardioides marmoriginsengisoli]
MARVVVIGGGFGGLASAARLAKLGHEVTLLEANASLGGALGYVEKDGFRWDAGPTSTLLPAVIRDFFRKSGRAAEKEIDLVPVEPARQHRFDEDTVLDLPSGSRAAQLEAIDAALGAGEGGRWASYCDDFAEVWEALRKDYFERPYSREHASKETKALLDTKFTLHKLVEKEFKNKHLRTLALHQARFEGHEPRNVPAWVGMWSYIEQNFGSWTLPGGMGQLTGVLTERLRTRGVTVITEAEADDLVVDVVTNKVTAVRATIAEVETDLPADVVVVAIDPRRLPTLAKLVERTMPVIPPVVSHIGVVGDVPELPHEVVLHGDPTKEPTLILRTNGAAPDGAHAWTVLGRGQLAEDIVTSLQRRGIRVRDQVEVRVDRSPRDLVEDWNGSPQGVLWQGRGTVKNRIGTSTPVGGVYCAGAHAAPGGGLPSVGLSAALVAQLVGPA